MLNETFYVIFKHRAFYLLKLYHRDFSFLRCGHAFSSYVYEPAIALPVFYDWLQKNGCTLVEKTIRKLNQLEGYTAVINCTGVGAKYLVEDHSIKPIRTLKY